jgi:hypothetical protein
MRVLGIFIEENGIFIDENGIFIDENDIILTAKLCQACRRMSTSSPYVLGVL